MAKKDLDWANIGFGYHKTDYRYVSHYKDGKWDDGALITDETMVIHESACVLQYAQTIFEGLKAYETVDGRIVTFRPDMNAERMMASAERMEMPVFPAERFLEAVDQTVRANQDWVPPYGSGASLYIRPYMFGSSAVIGVKPAEEYQFRLFTTPVGPYFKGGATPIALKISDYDRAAPRGTGHTKAGLNYAMSLKPSVEAHNEGYAENVYPDAATRTFVEETGGANIFFVDKKGDIIVPTSRTNSILPSITIRSVIHVAEKYCNMNVIKRNVEISEIGDFVEMGLTGTAAVISPVGKVNDHGKDIIIGKGMEAPGPVTSKLYETLTGIQLGTIEAPEGWIHEIPLEEK